MKKKILSAILTAAMTISVIPNNVLATENEHLIFGMDFDNSDMTTTVGKATLNGSISYADSEDGTKAAKFSGTAGTYISITNDDGSSLLTDKDEILVSFNVKTDNSKGWWFFASPNDNEQTYQKEQYVGILDDGSRITAERYKNNGSRTASTYCDYTTSWNDVKLAIGQKGSTLFINDKAVSNKDYDFTLSELLGENSVLYIGKANWGSGEWASGLIDNIKIYDFAPDIDLGDVTAVTENIKLPTPTEEIDGYTVLWETSDENVITSDGVITRADVGDSKATLTATITYDNETLTQEFDITVKGLKEMIYITDVNGTGIKKYNMSIDKENKSIFLPLIPQTDYSKFAPDFELSGAGKVELTSGTWQDGVLTITGDDGWTDNWTITSAYRGNSVLDGYYADPNMAVFNGKFYIYPTTDGGSGWNSTSFKAFSSYDMINWKDEGEILSLQKDTSWAGTTYAWAPTICEKNGKYYYYYSGNKNIGVAVADSPTGPFVDKGTPLVAAGKYTGQMIDPCAFVDDDGQGYIYWGNGKMYAAKLSDDMMSIEGEVTDITPSNFREAPFVIKRNGIYYFMWSDNDTGEPTYEVHYGTGTTPIQVPTGDTVILSKNNTNDSTILGTGHHSVINIPETDEWYICYHRFNIPKYGYITEKNSEAGNHREVCIDKMEFNDDGTIKVVTATLEGITEAVTIPNADSAILDAAAKKIAPPETAYGNFDMLTQVDDVVIEWTSDNSEIITKTGEVTRQTEETTVSLTAKLTYKDSIKEEKYTVKVPATVENKGEDDMEAYLFVHFTGTEGSSNHEQIYFSLSKDGNNWTTINNSMPILTSNMGEKGVRDPHIIRSPEGDRFFLIATDLSIYNRRDDENRWGTCQTSGSKSIVIWESDNLVDWSKARLVNVAVDDAGCTWAPETIYDDETGRYMIFWASKVASDNYSYQRIYRSYTRDFVNFTKPEIYIDDATAEDIKNDTAVSNIDTTFIKEDGVYYRFTKNESKSSVIMQKCDTLNGEFEDVATYTINGSAGNTITGYEGPTVYKLNGEEKWCMLLDYYSKSQGYKPFVTDSISEGVFVSANDFNFDSKYRHGCVIPITLEEYNALMKEYTESEEDDEIGDLIFSLDFANSEIAPKKGGVKVNGTVDFADGMRGKALVLDGSDYIELTDKDGKSLLTGLDKFTVSFWTKTNGKSWLFYASPNDTTQEYKYEKYIGILDEGSKITCERYNNSGERSTVVSGSYTNGDWKHVIVVYKKGTFTLYINGVEVHTALTSVDISDLLGENSIAYIGKANWESGEYSDFMIDECRIYNYALSSDAVSQLYSTSKNTVCKIVAEYENDGGLVNVEIEDVSESDIITKEISTDSKKIMYWDSIESMKPLTDH